LDFRDTLRDVSRATIHRNPATTAMQYQEWPAPAGSEGLIRCLWTLRGGLDSPPGTRDADSDHDAEEEATAEEAEPALPDGCPELLLNFGEAWCRVERDGQHRRQPAAFLVGQITGPFVVYPTGRVDLLAIRFEPHGAARDLLLALPVASTSQAEASDAASATVAARLDAVATWARRFAAGTGHADVSVAAVVRQIVESRGAASIDAVAESQGVQLRTLQRRFLRQVGVSPKRLARIVRFHHVCLAWRRDPASLARVAADCGYCDESHLVRDFRAFVGEPPASFLRSLSTFTSHFL
jgi:AraC-like DNA-binding protein